MGRLSRKRVTRQIKDRFCIIGAGPSGLAMAAAFRQLDVPHDHLERHSAVGGIWDLENPGTPMYESAHFISSKSLSGFAGFPMPADYPDYPRRDQILNYLRSYAEHHGLADGIEFGANVQSVVPSESNVEVVVNGQNRTYRGVICASGVNWEPIIPSFDGKFSGELRHAITYRHPREFQDKRVLIVGLGNSAADIACDAARVAQATTVSVRRGYHFIPKHIFGKPADVFAHAGPQLPLWLEQLLFSLLQRLLVGDTTPLGMPKPDHEVLQSHPLLNDQLLHHLRHGDVVLKGNIERFEGDRIVFADGSWLEADLVLLATGYSRRIPYLDQKYLNGGSWAASNFLTCVNLSFPNLFTLGFAEINGSLYPHLNRLAHLIARIARAQLDRPEEAQRFFEWATKSRFDLTGGRRLIDSPRHAHYCDNHALYAATKKTFRRMGWPLPSA